MTDMEQQQKEVRKKALKLLEHMDRTEKGYMIGFSVPAFRKLWQQMLSHM